MFIHSGCNTSPLIVIQLGRWRNKSRDSSPPRNKRAARKTARQRKKRTKRRKIYICTLLSCAVMENKRKEKRKRGKKEGGGTARNTEEEEQRRRRRRRRRKESLREPHEYLDSSWFPRSHTVYTGTGSPVIQRFMPVPVELTSASSLLRCFFSLSPDDRPGSDEEKGRRCERKRNGNSSKSRRPSMK